MKVPAVTRGGTSDAARRKKVSGGHGAEFADTLREAAARGAGEVAQAPAAQGVSAAFLAHQADDAAEEGGRGAARRYADDILEQLEELRLALLAGRIPEDRLARIAQVLGVRRQASSDPELNAIIDEIELRAQVEIAKFSRDR